MFKALIDLIFPCTCVGCLQPLELNERHICTHCRFELPKTNAHLEPDIKLINKFVGKVALTHCLSYLKFVRGGKVQRIMHDIKYNGNEECGEMIGRWYGAELRESNFQHNFDLVIPVPLHKSRLESRGYNQADCIAKGLAESLGLAYNTTILKREKKTDTQIRKSRIERYRNMEDVFVVTNSTLLIGKHIVIVDDTLTTGATLESCAVALTQAGVKQLSIIAMASA
jgi:ComF family protein